MKNTNTIQGIVSVGTLGGTITMTAAHAGQGVDSTLGAEQLMSVVPGLDQVVSELRIQTLANLASGSISFADLFKALDWADQQIAQGANGVVLVQGTDTLEETAFFLDLYWPHEEPLVLTGAMRSPGQAGAEGSGNLLAAVQVANSAAASQRGALVVMNDEIHQARFVRKVHTTALNAFASPIVGPVGVVREGQAVFYRQPAGRFILNLPTTCDQTVLLLETTLGEDALIYEHLATLGYSGLVIAGLGSGHVSIPVRDALKQVVKQMPVLMASRTGAGSTSTAVYGYPGSEIDLQQEGVIMVGSLCPRKARLLLSACLWQGLPRAVMESDLQEVLAIFSYAV